MKFSYIQILAVSATGALAASSTADSDAVPTAMPSASPEILACWKPVFEAQKCKNQDWNCLFNPSSGFGTESSASDKTQTNFENCMNKLGPDALQIASEMQQFAGVQFQKSMGIFATAEPTENASGAAATATGSSASSSATGSSTVSKASGSSTGTAASASSTSGASYSSANVLAMAVLGVASLAIVV